LEYLSKSTGQIIWGLLKAWATSWGLFKFDRDNVFEVIDLLVQDIEHAVAEQTKNFIGRAGIAVEKEQILRMVRMLKGMIARKIQRHLGLG
jgi:benzoyl-CoA reductase/2-hydroxyglutaryl-CoA dehydratase subunit BcrC/BadD/HgdB